MAVFAAARDPVALRPVQRLRHSPPLAKMSCFLTLAAMRAIPLLILALACLTACGVEQSQPAPVTADDRWGHLPPDPERPQQAEQATAPRG